MQKNIKKLKNNLKKIYYTIFKHKKREVPIPSEDQVFVGKESFVRIGEEFKDYFVDLGRLKPTDKILDVGCGIGRMAIALTGYLSPEGRYYGFDVVKSGIEWCQDHISPLYPNFHFTHADIINKYYNRGGTIEATEYTFPYDDNSFDFVFLTSVFTHTLPGETERYLAEIDRVLRPGGRTFITYFLINKESKQLIAAEKSSLPFKKLSELVYTTDLQVPEKAIAYDEQYILDLYSAYNFTVENISYGKWCEREKYLSFQDIVVTKKE